MSNVKFPIETTKEGNKITKVCVEDVYKMIDRVNKKMTDSYNNSVDYFDELWDASNDSYYVIGKGTSQPVITDAFDEEIGNNIAFMKSKLNANIKKRNLLIKVYNQFLDLVDSIDDEIYYLENLIEMDLTGIRNYNPEYLEGFEEKNKFIGYEEE